MSSQAMLDAVMSGAGAPLGAVTGCELDGVRSLSVAGVQGADGSPVTAATRFDLASVTKVVATTCALNRLAVLGQLQPADEVSRYLPVSPCTPGTTLADLLTHRAGLWEWQPLYLAGGDPWATLNQLPLRYRPGVARHYSDLGFMLLGEVVARVAGLPLSGAVTELVTGPLGLAGTSYGPVDGEVAASSWGDRAERTMVATGDPYPVLFAGSGFAWREYELRGEANDGNAHHCFGGISGHAGLFGAVPDLLTVASSLARGDDLWGGALATFLTDGPDPGQALGWRSLRVRYRGREARLLWHTGFTGCGIGFLPGVDAAFALASNRLLAASPPTSTALWLGALAPTGLAFDSDTEGLHR